MLLPVIPHNHELSAWPAGQTNAAERDYATAAAAALCISHGANIIRAHNVTAAKDAARVADAVHQAC